MFIPIPLLHTVPICCLNIKQASCCTHTGKFYKLHTVPICCFKHVLQTGLGHGHGYEWHSSSILYRGVVRVGSMTTCAGFDSTALRNGHSIGIGAGQCETNFLHPTPASCRTSPSFPPTSMSMDMRKRKEPPLTDVTSSLLSSL